MQSEQSQSAKLAEQHDAKILLWTKVNSIATLATAVGTFFAVAFAFWAVTVYREQRDIARIQLDDLKDSIRANATATLYAQGNEVTRFVGQYHDVYVYFYRDDPEQSYSQRDTILWDRFKTEKDEVKVRVWMAAQLLADYYEQAFLLNTTNPPPPGPMREDWITWRAFILDSYAESPMIREWFRRRDTWYRVHKLYLEPDFRERLKKERERNRAGIKTRASQ
jgi:hypothetical protein